MRPLWMDQTRVPLAIEEPPRMGDYYAGLTDDQWTELVWGHGLSGKTPAIVAYSLFHYKDLARTIGHLGHNYMAIIGDAFAFGALKYGRVGDWRDVPLGHHLQAAGRHFQAWLQDPASTDTESGLTHEAHFLARAVMIQWLRQNRSTNVPAV